jgi:hypothetical protein
MRSRLALLACALFVFPLMVGGYAETGGSLPSTTRAWIYKP